MLCGFVVGLFTSVIPLVRIEDFGIRLTVITVSSAVVWLAVMLLTPPESDEVLERFVRQVQPPGPGWARWRERCGVDTVDTLPELIQRFVLANGVLFGGLLGIGAFLLHQQWLGWGCLVLLVVCALALRPRSASSAF